MGRNFKQLFPMPANDITRWIRNLFDELERNRQRQVPKIIEFRDELPKTNVGKILRRELR